MNFTLYAILYFTVIVGFFSIGFLVSLRQKNVLYRNFSIFCFLIGAWQFLQFWPQFIDGSNLHLGNILFRLSIGAADFMAVYFLFFAAAYTGKQLKRIVFLLGAGAASLTAFSSPVLSNARIGHGGIGIETIDIPYGLALAYAGVCALSGLGFVLSSYVTSKNGKRRNQSLTLLLSIFQAVVVVFATSLLNTNVLTSQVAVPLSCLVAVCIITYSMVYHDLFDIHLFVLRAAAYLSTFFLITLLFITPTILIFGYFLDFNPHTSVLLLTIIAAVSVAYVLQYLRALLDRFTSRLFFRNLYDPQDVLDKISDVLVRNVELQKISEESAEVLKNAIKPDFVRFVLLASHIPADAVLAKHILGSTTANILETDELEHSRNPLGPILKKNGIVLGVKLRTNQDELGFLVLGYKQSGEIYSPRDRRLLSTAADEIAIGVQNALRFEEIENFNVTLRREVEDATRQLQRTNAKLRKLDETKDEFISMASHQLRTPLTSVKGYVSMVLDGDGGSLTPMQTKLLNQSFISSQRMTYLISDLLNVSRLRTGKFVIEPMPSNLAVVVQEEVKQLVETAKGRNLELIYHKPAHFPTLLVDEVKMRQVMMNFMDNAIYYTPSGGHITVNLVEKPNTIEFTVVDDGIGVPKHEQHHMFSKFYRADNAKNARPDGTGLGLFMAKKVIIAQGGSIIFKSREGKGSTFGFSFTKSLLLPHSPSHVGDKQLTN